MRGQSFRQRTGIFPTGQWDLNSFLVLKSWLEHVRYPVSGPARVRLSLSGGVRVNEQTSLYRDGERGKINGCLVFCWYLWGNRYACVGKTVICGETGRIFSGRILFRY